MISLPAAQDSDPALSSDKNFLIQAVEKALTSGGLTLGFKSSHDARSVRRRMYHIAQHLASYNRQRVNQVEFRLKGRMIVIMPKKTLSSTIVEEGET